MSFLSNLTGTFQNTFIINKNGSKLIVSSNNIAVYDYNGVNKIPISVGSPLSDNNAITLQYLNTQNGSEIYNVPYSGITDPDISIGNDGDVYYKLNTEGIRTIYIKDSNIWKPYTELFNTDYVTYSVVESTSWTLNTNGTYSYVLLNNIHSRGENIIVQIQREDGSIYQPQLSLNSSGDIELTQITTPVNIKILIIGDTNVSTTYNKVIATTDWTLVDSKYRYIIPSTAHLQVGEALFIAAYRNNDTTPSTLDLTMVDTQIDSSFNVTLLSSTNFAGKIVISGK